MSHCHFEQSEDPGNEVGSLVEDRSGEWVGVQASSVTPLSSLAVMFATYSGQHSVVTPLNNCHHFFFNGGIITVVILFVG